MPPCQTTLARPPAPAPAPAPASAPAAEELLLVQVELLGGVVLEQQVEALGHRKQALLRGAGRAGGQRPYCSAASLVDSSVQCGMQGCTT